MRIRDLKTLLQVSLPRLDLGYTNQPNNVTSFARLSVYRSVVNELAQVPILSKEVDAVKSLSIMTDARDEVTLPTAETGPVNLRVSELKNRVAHFLALIDPVVEAETETTVAIGLPDGTSLEEFPKRVEKVEAYFDLFVGLPVGEGDERFQKVQLRGTDTGSLWLVILLSSPAAVRLLAAVLKSSVELLRSYQRQEQEIGMFSLLNEDTRDAVKHHKMLRRALRRKLAGDIAPANATPEEVNKLAAIIHRGEKMITERTQIVCSRLAPLQAVKEIGPKALQNANPIALLPPDLEAKLLTEGDDEEKPSMKEPKED